jgi:NADH-quinone oxidoreductase subunit B
LLLNFGLACCGIELIAASMSKHDFIRFGVIPVAHGPRQADLLIVADTVTDKKMLPPLRRVYEPQLRDALGVVPDARRARPSPFSSTR